jgi:ATP-dependent Clp protease ATP-binding subunit ClpC
MAGTERMTGRARRVMALAEQEGRRRGAATVEPEHVLLGLAQEGDGLAANVLRSLGASAERLSQELPAQQSALDCGTEPLPWSAGTEKVVAQALAELLPLDHHYVGTEHLVLAVVQASPGPVSDVLARLGVAAESVRSEVYNILGHGV